MPLHISFVTLKCLLQEVVWHTKTVQMTWELFSLSSVAHWDASTRTWQTLGPRDTPALRAPAHPSWESHGRSCPSHCTTGPACSSLSPVLRCCWLQLCPDSRKVKKNANKNLSCRFLFFGSPLSHSIVGQWHTEKCCSSHLDFSSFCSRCIWLFTWSLSFLVPIPGTKIKYFPSWAASTRTHYHLFQFPLAGAICFTAAVRQSDCNLLLCLACFVDPKEGCCLFVSCALSWLWDLPGFWMSCAADPVCQHRAN